MTPTKFDNFTLPLMKGEIDFLTDTFKEAFCNVAPDPAADTVFGDITEIGAAHGYLAGGLAINTTAVTDSAGVTSVIADDTSITPVGGGVGPFRYIVRYRSNGTQYLMDVLDLGVEVTIPVGIAFNTVWDPANTLVTCQ